MKYRISAEARQDLADVLVYSAQQFGPAARKRYQSLVVSSFNLIAAEPYAPFLDVPVWKHRDAKEGWLPVGERSPSSG